ncbi:MAG: hypothetical protein IT165_06465 [Bryobacterales bacterium]|nr:hypothetical protein [Bryobacterales bacterium]
MAERPVFVPSLDEPDLVRTLTFSFVWNPGFAVVQKQKNIAALHQAAARSGCSPLLEISTKSDEGLGRQLSAFNLTVQSQKFGELPLECAFQGSKVFERGGPYTDLYRAEPRNAKRDPRLQWSGRLVGFMFEDQRFPLEPKTVFYDWLFISALWPQREALGQLCQYGGFTDIEFNPERSLNCQARSCALFVALTKAELLDAAMSSEAAFARLLGQRRSRI